MTRPPTFSFGRNWQRYLGEMHPAAVDAAVGYVRDWLGELDGRSFLDVGSGSGLTSLVAHRLGAKVTSFDIDPESVAATTRLWEAAGRPDSWRIRHGSVLDPAFAAELGAFDDVMSWGVLHHTGELWRAIDATAGLVRPGGRLWLALYHRTRQSGRSLSLKRLYNRLPGPLKPLFRAVYAALKIAKSLVVRRRLPPIGSYHSERGMSWWRDIEDWLGGLPYEVSSPGEVVARLRPLGFTLERLADAIAEAGNDVYLFRREVPPG